MSRAFAGLIQSIHHRFDGRNHDDNEEREVVIVFPTTKNRCSALLQILIHGRMNEPTQESPKKRAKPTTTTTTSDDNASKLPALLRRLNGGNPLPLSTLAVLQVPTGTTNEEEGDDSIHHVHLESAHAAQKELLQAHVGDCHAIFQAAVTIARNTLDRAVKEFNGMEIAGDEQADFFYPWDPLTKGPKPDAAVWAEMFLGRERFATLVDRALPLNHWPRRSNLDRSIALEEHIYLALRDNVPKLSALQLLENVLDYLLHRVKEDKTATRKDFLRFTVVYGLDGAMKDVLNGAYSCNKNDDDDEITINTLLPLSDGVPRPPDEENMSRFHRGPMYMFLPAYALGAMIGHVNVVSTAIGELHATIDAPLEAFQGNSTPVCHYHYTPGEVLFGAIMTNRQHVLKCLVKEHGFQFRWINHDREMEMIRWRLLADHELDCSTFWTGDLDADDIYYEASSRQRRRLRARVSYQEQMKMLDLLIELGLPFLVLFPADLYRYIERLQQGSMEELRTFEGTLSKDEKKMKRIVWEACSSYNNVRQRHELWLSMGEFYSQQLNARWAAQHDAQTIKLGEYEALDSRWRAQMEEGNGESSNSDGESEY